MNTSAPERSDQDAPPPAAASAQPDEERVHLSALRRGDPAALDWVVRSQSPRLLRLALRLCGRKEDAEDLVQETLVRALPKLATFEGRSQIGTYLVRALTNQWKNRLRSKSRSRIVGWFRLGKKGEEVGDDVAVDPTPLPDLKLEGLDRAEAVRRAVQHLEPHRRLALLLREVEEYSYEQIAELTEAPIGTVRSRIARARTELRDLMGGVA